MVRVNNGFRNKVNKELHRLGTYHNSIPLGAISEIINSYGYVIIQEDLTAWDGFLLGRDSFTSFNLAENECINGVYPNVVKNCTLQLSWYKFDTGRYEIVCYVS